ncbi:hypothetical protein [Chamaesiphon minutus]|uniref:Uncharacterized protein n=1 Tax=Chamaesiphon minutus (strain ATCC 27169 / PCC 6605) TaxID=1173020 RepID=K9UH53_CHAP6|nr:hypothetical protein [Chamaesiphon minutus]AFY94432.1 hypothetical protein Cha6605_3440 [Chamaesiphon minutus PCC 6605]
MKVYILKDKYGEFANPNCAIADDGFRQMGWEIVAYGFRQSVPKECRSLQETC